MIYRYAVIFGLLIAPHCRSQSFPFPDSAAVWVQYWEFMVTPPPLPQFEIQEISNICFTGADTLIDGSAFKQLRQCNGSYMGALRSDTGRVEFVPADSSLAYLLYDFNVETGDTIHEVYVDGGLAFSGYSSYPDLVTYVVYDISQIDGRKVIWLEQPLGGPEQIWIEGFGSPFGLFSQQDWINVSGYWAGISCMSHRDTSWYFNAFQIDSVPGISCIPIYLSIEENSTSWFNAYPNPTTGWTRIETSPDQNIRFSLFDQFGRSLNVPYRIENGSLEFDLTGLAFGFYFATLMDRDKSTTVRILKN